MIEKLIWSLATAQWYNHLQGKHTVESDQPAHRKPLTFASLTGRQVSREGLKQNNHSFLIPSRIQSDTPGHRWVNSTPIVIIRILIGKLFKIILCNVDDEYFMWWSGRAVYFRGIVTKCRVISCASDGFCIKQFVNERIILTLYVWAGVVPSVYTCYEYILSDNPHYRVK